LQLPASRATIFTKEGVLKETINDDFDGALDGVVTVTVGTSPIYIEVE
jgi:hypothetical protein